MRKTLIGVVTSDRNSKTRRVDVKRLFQHPTLKKIVRGRTVCYVHDEDNTSKVGDTVEITESRPRSKTKRWELVRVVHSTDDVAAQLIRQDQDDAKAAATEETAAE
ncbi:MAG: 30S ribosomal protein S17 [Planctomycetaceae bacterium]|nr:30S ribosomal protein S17 [Planctomycetaceae bacterium]